MDLVKVDHKQYGVEETKAMEIRNFFVPMLDKMVLLEEEYNDPENGVFLGYDNRQKWRLKTT